MDLISSAWSLISFNEFQSSGQPVTGSDQTATVEEDQTGNRVENGMINCNQMSHVTRNPVFGASDQVRHKPD